MSLLPYFIFLPHSKNIRMQQIFSFHQCIALVDRLVKNLKLNIEHKIPKLAKHKPCFFFKGERYIENGSSSTNSKYTKKYPEYIGPE